MVSHRYASRIDLSGYVEKFNSKIGEPSSVIFDGLKELSEELCKELNVEHPLGHDGELFQLPPENLLWASNLILSAWLGWVHKSKSIWHYDRTNPDMEKVLATKIVPSVIEAFGQGISKAIEDKISEGKYPTSIDRK